MRKTEKLVQFAWPFVKSKTELLELHLRIPHIIILLACQQAIDCHSGIYFLSLTKKLFFCLLEYSLRLRGNNPFDIKELKRFRVLQDTEF